MQMARFKELLLLFVLGVTLAVSGCGTRETSQTAAPAEPSAKQEPNPQVLIETTKGNITIELFPDKAPVSVENFLGYVIAGFYDGTVFHRVIPGFMIQGGGMLPDLTERPTLGPIKNEADNGLKNVRGTLAMARTGDPHSATAQFFINVADNDFLDHHGKNFNGWGYAVFGKVVSGMEVADAIVAVPRGDRGMHQDVPHEPVIMKRVTLIKPQP